MDNGPIFIEFSNFSRFFFEFLTKPALLAGLLLHISFFLKTAIVEMNKAAVWVDLAF